MKFKKLLSVILALALFSGVVPITAYSDEGTGTMTESETIIEIEDSLYEITDENEITTLEGCGWLLRSDGTLIVGGDWYRNWISNKDEVSETAEPNDDGGITNGELAAKVILGYQFKREKDGEYETVARSAHYIQENAFKDCTNVKTFAGLEYVSEIDEGAFENCASVESVEFKNPVYLSSRAFAGCSNLKSVTITQLPSTYDVSEDGSELLYPEPGEETPAPYKMLPFAADTFDNTSDELVIHVPGEYFEQLKLRFPEYADRFTTQDASKRFSLSVNGVVLTENEPTVRCGGGTASFDPKTYTLTLENAVLTDSKKLENTDDGSLTDLVKRSAAIYCGIRELEVVLKGQNIVGKYLEGDQLESELQSEYFSGYANDFIRTTGSLIITGDGTLETRLVGPGENEGEYTIYDKSATTNIFSERSITFSKVNLEISRLILISITVPTVRATSI